MISDDAFFEDLCDEYFKKAYDYCRKLLKAQKSAEECTQITFLEARKQITKLRKHPNIEGWLYATSRNQINTMFRRQYIRENMKLPRGGSVRCFDFVRR